MALFPASGPVALAHGSSLLLRLRLETESEHRQLERQLDLMRPGLTAAEYRGMLERILGFYAPWEQQIDPLIRQWLPEFGVERRKTPKLIADLRYLEANIEKIELRNDPVTYPDKPDLMGALYVSEGSTLGGQIVAKHVKRELNLAGNEGCLFFSSYGSAVGRKWRAFQDLLIRNTSIEMEDRVIGSARQTFRDLRQWMCML